MELEITHERYRLLQHLQNSNCSLPVIIITGKLSERSEAFCLERGVRGFFRKPVDGDAQLGSYRLTLQLGAAGATRFGVVRSSLASLDYLQVRGAFEDEPFPGRILFRQSASKLK